MRKSIFVLAVVLLLVAAVPVAAGKGNDPVGEQISVFPGAEGPDEYPAGDPFHIRHGWAAQDPSTDSSIGHFVFELEVDGEYVRHDHLLVTVEDGLITRVFLFNFPDGMTGQHTFTGHWLMPCRYAVDNGLYAGECAKPNEEVEVLFSELTVDFYE